jgi:protein-histidine N-methyltransferase
VHIPLVYGSGGTVTLSRRDLFDARFQLIAQTADDAAAAQDASDPATADRQTTLDFVDAPSDLVPGLYEGGLKTWECSLDLVDYLHRLAGADAAALARGKRILEVRP